MATPPEQPWSNHEKNYLLTEIIKSANPPADVLLNVLRQLRFEPRWEETPLPPGRSLNSSRYAYDELRRSLSGMRMGAAIAPNTPTPLSGPMSTLKRPYHQYDGSYSAGAGVGREIRPKPSISVGQVYSQPSPTDQPVTKRKRGRPTKAEALAKAEAAASSASISEAGPATISRSYVRSPPQPTQVPVAAATSAPPEEAKPGPLSTTRMPIAAMLTPTAQDLKSTSQSHSSSSSGRRRRARSTKSEPEESPEDRGSRSYESPYTLPGPPGTPARAAVLRHRDDPSSASRTAPPEAATVPTGGHDPPPGAH